MMQMPIHEWINLDPANPLARHHKGVIYKCWGLWYFVPPGEYTSVVQVDSFAEVLVLSEQWFLDNKTEMW